jgi:hypothetical protein
VYRSKELLRDEQAKKERIQLLDLDKINADPKKVGLVGSPTVVGKTWKIGEKGGSCRLFKGAAVSKEVETLVDCLSTEGRGIEEYVR